MPTPKEIKDAQNGGDFRELFGGKKLKLRFAKVLKEEAWNQIDLAEDESLRKREAPVKASEPLLLLAKGIRAEEGLEWIKTKFFAMIDSMNDLKLFLEEALQPVLMSLSFRDGLEAMFKTIPNAFTEFVKGIVDALIPFVGQILSVAEALKGIGTAIKAKIESIQIKRSFFSLDASSEFTVQARKHCENLINDELDSLRNEALVSTGNAVVSITGLVFTGNLASMLGGIAISIAKLIARISTYVKLGIIIHKGNAELEKIGANPKTLNPCRLFEAAPILGAHYVGSATQSSIISFTEVDKLEFGSSLWNAQYEMVARSLSPLRLKALRLVSESSLELC